MNQTRKAAALVIALCVLGGCLEEPPTQPNGSTGNGNDPPPPNEPNRGPRSQPECPAEGRVGEPVVVRNRAVDPDGDRVEAFSFRTPFEDITVATERAALFFAEPGVYAVDMAARDARGLWGEHVLCDVTIVGGPREVLFLDEGTLPLTEVGYVEPSFPSQGTGTVTHNNGVRVVLHEGRSGMGLATRKIFAPASELQVEVKAQGFAEYRGVPELARDYGLVLLVIDLYEGRREDEHALASYLIVWRTMPPFEGHPGFPAPLEDLLPRHQRARVPVLRSGARVDEVINVGELIRSQFDRRDVTVERVGAIRVAFLCQTQHGRDDVHTRMEVDLLKVFTE